MAAAHPRLVKSACALERMVVRTSAGVRLGHVFDLRMDTGADSAPAVTAVVYGSKGLLERLGLRHAEPTAVPWDRVRSIDAGVIVVDDDAKARRPSS